MEFGLNLASGAGTAPQLVLAVASAQPLTRAATTRDGALAEEVLPRVLEEIMESGLQASAALSFILLSPADAPEPAPASGGSADQSGE